MTSSSSDGWHYLLVGHQWPNSSAETTLDAAATNRGEIAAAFETYSGMLASVRNGALGSQEGVTADDARAAFQVGEEQSRDLASRNLTKKAAYSSAAQSVSALRAELSEIADRGESGDRSHSIFEETCSSENRRDYCRRLESAGGGKCESGRALRERLQRNSTSFRQL